MTTPKNGWNLNRQALKTWVFSNWAFLENIMRMRLGFTDEDPLVIVKLDGCFSHHTHRFSRPRLELYSGRKSAHGYTTEYAIYSVSENQVLSFLVANRIIDNPCNLEFTRSELAGRFFEPSREAK